MASIEEAYATLQMETVSYGLNASKKGGPGPYDDRVAAGDLPWVAAARDLALAVLEDMNYWMREEARQANDGFWLQIWDARETQLRREIEALGS